MNAVTLTPEESVARDLRDLALMLDQIGEHALAAQSAYAHVMLTAGRREFVVPTMHKIGAQTKGQTPRAAADFIIQKITNLKDQNQ